KKEQAQTERAAASKDAEEAQAARAAAHAQARAKADAESKARAAEESARATDLADRRQKAEAEAAAIRSMMSTPKKVLVAKKAEEAKPVAKPTDATAKPAAKGTLHKPTVSRPGTGAPAPAAPGGGKEVKSAKLSSSWAADPSKKKAIPTRGDASGGVGRNSWRGGPRGRRGNERDQREEHVQAPVEQRIIEVHVPETITVAELAHKMAIKASEVIKALMK